MSQIWMAKIDHILPWVGHSIWNSNFVRNSSSMATLHTHSGTYVEPVFDSYLLRNYRCPRSVSSTRVVVGMGSWKEPINFERRVLKLINFLGKFFKSQWKFSNCTLQIQINNFCLSIELGTNNQKIVPGPLQFIERS